MNLHSANSFEIIAYDWPNYCASTCSAIAWYDAWHSLSTYHGTYFLLLKIWEVPENNERRVYLFLHFQVFGSFPKPDAQRAILQTLIWYVLLALPVWEIPLKYSSDFIARRLHRVVWFPAQDFLEEITALCPVKHVLEKYATVSDKCIQSD